MKTLLLPRLFLLLMAAWCPLHGFASQGYTITDLGPGIANDVNNSGHVVGTRLAPNVPSYDYSRGFFFDGKTNQLVTTTNNMDIASADGINDVDHISGRLLQYYPGALRSDVFLLKGERLLWFTSIGYAANAVVNNNDIVAGSKDYDNAPYRYRFSFIGTRSVKAALSRVYGINDSNVAVGAADVGWDGRSQTYQIRACVMAADGTVTFIDPRPAGVIRGEGDDLSYGYGINNAGHVVGEMRGPSGKHAFRYTGGALEDLGTLGGAASTARDINATDQVVGESQVADGATHAFLWQNGVMTDLNTFLPVNSGWVLTRANALNDRGDIVGVGTFGGADHAFLLSAPMVALTPIVTATFAGGAVTLKWDAKNGAAQKVLRAPLLNGPYTQVATGTLADSYTETPPAGAGHYYRIVWP